MKTVGIAAVVLSVLCGTASATLSGVALLSETHHIWNEATACAASQLYDQTAVGTYSPPAADSQRSLSAAGSGLFICRGDGWQYQAQGTCSSAAGGFAVEAHAGAGTQGLIGDAFLCACAESSYVFRPLADLLQVEYTGTFSNPWELRYSILLVDTTTGTCLEDYKGWPYIDNPHFLNLTKTYGVDASHGYTLTISACAFVGGPSLAGDADLCLMLTTIPAPAALLLGGIGVGFVGGLRRRRVV